MRRVESVFFVAALAAVVSSGAALDDGARWTLLGNTTVAPSPVRGEFTMNEWNGGLLLYGGCNIAFNVFYNDLWVANIEDGEPQPEWKRVQTTGDTPDGSCGHGSVVVGDFLYVYGGLVEDGTSDELHRLDLHSRVWRKMQRKSGTWPPPRSLIQHSMVQTLPGRFVVASGVSSEDSDDDSAFEFDTNLLTWKRVSHGQAAMSGNVGGSAAVYSTHGLFVLGGYRHGSLSSLLHLNFSTGEFKAVGAKDSNIGKIAFEGAVTLRDRYMVVYGGFNNLDINPYVWVRDLTDMAGTANWCKVNTARASTPPPHFAAGWTNVGESIYAFAGRIHPAGTGEELSYDLWRVENVLNSAVLKCLAK